MPQSLSAVYVHLVFSTLDRHPFLSDKTARESMHAYLGGITNKIGCEIKCVGGVSDHVHLLAELGRTVTIADWVRDLKKSSTPWAREEPLYLRNFGWQSGYGISSVSYRDVNMVRAYIENQEARHGEVSFQDEYRALLEEFGLTWNEDYVWG